MTKSVSITDAQKWARTCRIESARATHQKTREFLLELAAEYDAIAGKPVSIDPDDPALQGGVADRLHAVAARRKHL